MMINSVTVEESHSLISFSDNSFASMSEFEPFVVSEVSSFARTAPLLVFRNLFSLDVTAPALG